jgi:hypothetical protein
MIPSTGKPSRWVEAQNRLSFTLPLRRDKLHKKIGEFSNWH